VNDSLQQNIRESVALALAEDIGSGDLTAVLIPSAAEISATILCRQDMTMAGQPWLDEVMRQVDAGIDVEWQHQDGDRVVANTILCRLRGPARSLLSAERTALNFLQLLSATATTTADYVAAVATTECRILDTRKTVPGLRLAQKYAVRCGGGVNHRIGLFDAILIKENHIMSAGGIAAAVIAARDLHPNLAVEVEVENIDELHEALGARAERLLLDNFSLQMLREAVAINRDAGDARAELEASGGITLASVAAIAASGVDFISVGALTKDVSAVDLSMRFSELGKR
jgi:nicotinate-nucleotide pyrophosphorylase (carboxylating)